MNLGYIFPMQINRYMDVPGTGFFPQSEVPIFYAQISTLLKRIFKSASYHTCRPAVNQIMRESDFSHAFLSAGEMETLNGFKALKKQMEWVCGRFMIKHLVRSALSGGENPTMAADRPLAEITLQYHDKGAPYVEDVPDLSITLSHSGNYTAVGLSLDPDIHLGLDIEAIAPMPDDYFLKTAFTQKEIQAMDPTPEGVFRSWTLKEAFLKYIGMGFNENLHQVEILGDRICHRGKDVPLTLYTRTLDQSYILSIVTGTP